jgi:hypothetical protein
MRVLDIHNRRIYLTYLSSLPHNPKNQRQKNKWQDRDDPRNEIKQNETETKTILQDGRWEGFITEMRLRLDDSRQKRD